MTNLALITDNASLHEALAPLLSSYYNVIIFPTDASFESMQGDLILLDAPSVPFVKEVHHTLPEIPILCLISKSQVGEYKHLSYIKLLEKPFTLKSLIKTLSACMPFTYEIGPFIFYPTHRFLREIKTHTQIPLTEKETHILLYLYQMKGQPIAKEKLLEEIWQYNPEMTTHTLETHIYRLRKKLMGDKNFDLLHSHEQGYVLLPSS